MVDRDPVRRCCCSPTRSRRSRAALSSPARVVVLVVAARADRLRVARAGVPLPRAAQRREARPDARSRTTRRPRSRRSGSTSNVTTLQYSPSTHAARQGARAAGQHDRADSGDRPEPAVADVQRQAAAAGLLRLQVDPRHRATTPSTARSQDVAIAVRELQPAGIPEPSWVNNHLVYTHGYGVVAAPTDRGGPADREPGLPRTAGCRRASRSRSPARRSTSARRSARRRTRSSASRPAARDNLEFDHPGSNGSSTSAHTTYQGHGGIPIGSTLRRFLFAVQLHDPNIFFSSELNSASQLLTVRNPRARVAKVAPWLTLDGDVYPAVVNGQIKWIVDGYTTSSNYPELAAGQPALGDARPR